MNDRKEFSPPYLIYLDKAQSKKLLAALLTAHNWNPDIGVCTALEWHEVLTEISNQLESQGIKL